MSLFSNWPDSMNRGVKPVCVCSAQLSMFNMEKRYRNKIIIIFYIIIIIIIIIILLITIIISAETGNRTAFQTHTLCLLQ